MKKTFLFFTLSWLCLGAFAQQNEVYTSFNESTGTLTYYFDDQREVRKAAGETTEVYDPETAHFAQYYDKVFVARIDESMKNANLNSMKNMFYGGCEDLEEDYYCYNLENLESIEGMDNLVTDHVTDMYCMFHDCSSLTSLNLSKFNTENVTNMSLMFDGCSALTSLDLSNFNTARVTNMYSMFAGCTSLESVNLSSFRTEEVETMSAMFDNCKNLTTLDLSNFNTAKVKKMSSMFNDCENLKSLNLSNFNTSNVETMYQMFSGCKSLESLDLNSFNTANVTNMANMFENCNSLKALDLSKFNTEKVTNMFFMFYYCSSLTSLDVSMFNTGNVKDMSSMFGGCSKLTSLDLSNFNTENATDMSYMFSYCSKLASIDLSKFNTENVKDMRMMFQGCSALTSLDLSNFNTSTVQDMQNMFNRCSKLTSIDLSKFNTDKVTNMSSMFEECEALTSLDLSKFNTGKVKSMSGMFEKCTSLNTIDLRNFDIAKVEDMRYMFSDCKALTTILCADDWSKSEVLKKSGDMFRRCNLLVGGNGTQCDGENNTDKTYARLDGGESAPGYFSTKKEVYTEFDESTGTLTYYCDDRRTARTGITEIYDPVNRPYALRFKEYHDKVLKARFDVSMKDTMLTSMRDMFNGNYGYSDGHYEYYYLSEMTEISEMENLITDEVKSMERVFFKCYKLSSLDLSHFNTANVENMEGMFSNCHALTSLDLSSFNTSKVTNMGIMFIECYNLKSVNLSSFNTAQVEDMDGMFEDCKSLTSLDLSSFNTDKVENMKEMFFCCSKLTTLDLSSFNTANATTMYHLFKYCSSLKSIDLRNFNIGKVKNMKEMFAECPALTTIYCNDDWSTSAVLENSDDMFKGCTSLVGGAGTQCDGQNNIDIAYARFDGGENAPGYFTEKTTEVYTSFIEASHLLIYYCDNLRGERKAAGEITEIYDPVNRPWAARFKDYYDQVYSVYIDESMKDTMLTSMRRMFNGGAAYTDASHTGTMYINLSALEVISGWENLITDEVTDMEDMFSGCSALNAVDLSRFNTAKVTNMQGMFLDCSSLKTIDLSNFNTGNVTNMQLLFSGCSSLKSIDLSKFNTENVQYMGYMFKGCTSLKSLDLSNFNTAKVTTMGVMFGSCTSLTSLELGNFNTAKVENMSQMFSGCSALKSLDLTAFNTSNVTDMEGMFAGCSSMTSLDIRHFNTAKVTNLEGMFEQCSALEIINLCSFNIDNVTTTANMFKECTALTFIYCNSDWTFSETLKRSKDMFIGCTSLGGGSGTACDGEHNINKEYARPDGGESAPGYFTSLKEAYTVFDRISTLTFYYDNQRGTHSHYDGIEELYPSYGERNFVRFEGYAGRVKNVVIDKSFKGALRNSLANMFYGASNNSLLTALESIEGLENITYANVTDMNSMFLGCSALQELDVTPLNTSKVTDMGNMFYGCSSLTELDLSGFKISSADNMGSMFYGCSSLTTIHCNHDWSTSGASASDMFYGCESLTGEYGTKCNGIDNIGKTYARPDKGESTPGYFTAKLTEAYTVYDDNTKTLTYYYDDQRHFREETGIVELYTPQLGSDIVRFEGYANKVKKAVIDKSFKNARLKSLANMFYGADGYNSLTELESIEGLDNINYSKVTNMEGMFRNCSKLQELDVTPINTYNVQNMNNMFYNCTSLKELDVNGFNIRNARLMSIMFANCTSLTTIYCKNDWSKTGATTNNMFHGCTSLVGGNGTKCNGETNVTAAFARYDGGEFAPGYFTRPLYPNGRFTVNEEGDQMQFSQGNLQFNAGYGRHLCADGTQQRGAWRFAVNQWDYAGDDNKNIGETYGEWIDLFGWGTSGWVSGAKEYQPWSTGTSYEDYLNSELGLTDQYAYADWGVYNQIENDEPGTWRTLTPTEWKYILNLRPYAGNLRGHATVNGVHGYIILPDNWKTPSGLTFEWGTDEGPGTRDWNANVYNGFDWNRMERAGAVFFPASGFRIGDEIGGVENYGYYWSSVQYNAARGFYFFFEQSEASTSVGYYNSYGRSVRLARIPEDAVTFTLTVTADGKGTVTGSGTYPKGKLATLTATPDEGSVFMQWSDGNKANPRFITMTEDLTLTAIFAEMSSGGDDISGVFSVDAAKKVTFSPGNLQYQASTGTWRFAEHEWDYIGQSNKNISDSYDGWIDMFGWGTGDAPTKASSAGSDYTVFTDWGTNTIGSDAPGTWRTLTSSEWDFLFNTRPDAANKYAAAKVNDIPGIVLLPDNWTLPEGCDFTAGLIKGQYDWYYVAASNKYTEEQWKLMKDAGAVFLPAAGNRYYNGSKHTVNYNTGAYWSSTSTKDVYSRAYNLDFNAYSMDARDATGYYWGLTVRLVSEIEEKPVTVSEPDITAKDKEPKDGTVTITVTAEEGAKIWYKVLINGESSGESWQEYTGPFDINPETDYGERKTITILAYAEKDGKQSEEASANYVFYKPRKPAEPVITSDYKNQQAESATVTITAEKGTTAWYKVVISDEPYSLPSNPLEGTWREYAEPFVVSPKAEEGETKYVTVLAYAENEGVMSEIATEEYIFSKPEPEDLEPLSESETTTFDFSLIGPDGSKQLGITLDAKDGYNAEEGRIEVASTNTTEEIDAKLNEAFSGAAFIKPFLPGTITFELGQGEGKIEIDCKTVPGYTLYVRIAEYGEAYITSTVEQEQRGKATVQYNVTQKTYVVIYLAGAPESAPARIARSEKDAGAGAYIWSITVTPKQTPTDVETPENNGSSDCKFIKDGILYILHDGRLFNAQGAPIR